MIEGEQKERVPYSLMKISRHPNPLLLIQQGEITVGQITIKDDFEEELWRTGIKMINEHSSKLKKI
jgi:hypothetical protein